MSPDEKQLFDEFKLVLDVSNLSSFEQQIKPELERMQKDFKSKTDSILAQQTEILKEVKNLKASFFNVMVSFGIWFVLISLFVAFLFSQKAL